MEFREFLKNNISIILIYCIFLIGAIGHLIPLLRDMMLSITPFFLLFMGIAVLIPTFLERNAKVILWALVVYILTLTIEIIGVYTGWIFGEYVYGLTLGMKFLSVPLVIGLNWTLVILGAIHMANRLIPNRYAASLLAGLISAAFDLVLEPVAIEYDYWHWEGGSIPIRNYAAWFAIATIFALSFNLTDLKIRNRLPGHYLVAQFFFFLLLRFSLLF
jgi:putative membrane protein